MVYIAHPAVLSSGDPAEDAACAPGVLRLKALSGAVVSLSSGSDITAVDKDCVLPVKGCDEKTEASVMTDDALALCRLLHINRGADVQIPGALAFQELRSSEPWPVIAADPKPLVEMVVEINDPATLKGVNGEPVRTVPPDEGPVATAHQFKERLAEAYRTLQPIEVTGNRIASVPTPEGVWLIPILSVDGPVLTHDSTEYGTGHLRLKAELSPHLVIQLLVDGLPGTGHLLCPEHIGRDMIAGIGKHLADPLESSV
jgi:hypothetical protein